MNGYVKLGLSVVVIAALGAAGVKKIKEARTQDATKPIAKIYPIVAPVIAPKLERVRLTLPYLAEVQNDKDVKLATRISARILSLKRSGEHVKKGDVIAKLDTTSIESSLKSVQNQLTAADIALDNLNNTHKRTLDLLKVHGASIEESQKESTLIAQTQAKIASLKQQEITLKNNLSYATIISPVDGVIAKTDMSVGSISLPGKPIASIASNSGFYMMVRVPNNVPIKGVIYNNNSYIATPLGTTFHGLAEYKVYTGQSNMTSGDRIEVDIIVFNDRATFLPFDALLDKNSKTYVLVANEERAQAVEVHILQSAEQGVVVSDDLSGKELVKAKPDILLKLTSGYKLHRVKG